MDALSRFSADLTSWYWWMSVVFVGLLINLVSAYLKPPIDKWFDQRSERRREARRISEERFDSETTSIGLNPTLLLLEGQRARHAETQYLLHCILTGVNIVLLFLIALQPEPRGSLMKLVGYLVAGYLPLELISMTAAMRERHAAQDRYEVSIKKSIQRVPNQSEA